MVLLAAGKTCRWRGLLLQRQTIGYVDGRELVIGRVDEQVGGCAGGLVGNWAGL